MGEPVWMLLAVEGRFSGQRFPVTVRGVSFGREADNVLVLEDDNVSRHHAVVKLVNGAPVLEDLKSRNGTFVNNQKVAEQALVEGDRIALGSHLFRVVSAADATREELADPEKTMIAPPDLGERRPMPVTMLGVPLGLEGFKPPDRVNLAMEPEGTDKLSPDGSLGAGGMVYGGAADAMFHNTVKLPQSTATELLLAPMDMGAPLPPPRKSGRRNLLFASLGAILVLGAGGGYLALQNTAADPASGAPAAPSVAPEPVAAEAPPSGDSGLFGAPPASGKGGAGRKLYTLTPEEQALPKEERVTRAQEHFEQGQSFFDADKLKEARDEFERALALDPDCKVCLIRLNKVDVGIKKTLEKYRSEALRAFESMEYDSARRSWEMVLELETDSVARREAQENLARSKAQLTKQPYR